MKFKAHHTMQKMCLLAKFHLQFPIKFKKGNLCRDTSTKVNAMTEVCLVDHLKVKFFLTTCHSVCGYGEGYSWTYCMALQNNWWHNCNMVAPKFQDNLVPGPCLGRILSTVWSILSNLRGQPQVKNNMHILISNKYIFVQYALN